jgi:N-acetylmuramoyl-L-alanine amidase
MYIKFKNNTVKSNSSMNFLFSLTSFLFIPIFLVGCNSSSSKNNTTLVETKSLEASASNIQYESGTIVGVKETPAPTPTAQNTASDTASSKANSQSSSSSSISGTSTQNQSTATKSSQSYSVNKNNKVIVLDAGHGGKSTSEKEPVSPDSSEMKPKNVSGATGDFTKTPEPVITLKVAQKLRDDLNSKGYTVIMTRNSSSETISNIERAEIGNENNAALVIRIHADSADSSSAKGASMLVPGEVGYAKDIYKISQSYGKTIFNTLLNEVGMKSRGVVTRTDLTGFNWSKVPVVLIEMGFLSNEEEDRLLSTDAYQDKIAAALSDGIDTALK